MDLIQLSPVDLSLAAILVLLLAAVSWIFHLTLSHSLLIAALRAVIQLSLIGFVLKILFSEARLSWILILAFLMLLLASYEIRARQKWRFQGFWGFGVGAISLFISSFTVILLALLLIIRVEPWYTPQYLIPLLGMLLGNAMTGIAVSLDHLTTATRQQQRAIEAQLSLGYSWQQAMSELRRNALRAGLIPIINAMASAGVINLPGMMTGQILGGSPPFDAAKYQILILFLIAATTGFGAIGALWLGTRHLFDDRQRLRLERLNKK